MEAAIGYRLNFIVGTGKWDYILEYVAARFLHLRGIQTKKKQLGCGIGHLSNQCLWPCRACWVSRRRHLWLCRGCCRKQLPRPEHMQLTLHILPLYYIVLQYQHQLEYQEFTITMLPLRSHRCGCPASVHRLPRHAQGWLLRIPLLGHYKPLYKTSCPFSFPFFFFF